MNVTWFLLFCWKNVYFDVFCYLLFTFALIHLLFLFRPRLTNGVESPCLWSTALPLRSSVSALSPSPTSVTQKPTRREFRRRSGLLLLAFALIWVVSQLVRIFICWNWFYSFFFKSSFTFMVVLLSYLLNFSQRRWLWRLLLSLPRLSLRCFWPYPQGSSST